MVRTRIIIGSTKNRMGMGGGFSFNISYQFVGLWSKIGIKARGGLWLEQLRYDGDGDGPGDVEPKLTLAQA